MSRRLHVCRRTTKLSGGGGRGDELPTKTSPASAVRCSAWFLSLRRNAPPACRELGSGHSTAKPYAVHGIGRSCPLRFWCAASWTPDPVVRLGRGAFSALSFGDDGPTCRSRLDGWCPCRLPSPDALFPSYPSTEGASLLRAQRRTGPLSFHPLQGRYLKRSGRMDPSLRSASTSDYDDSDNAHPSEEVPWAACLCPTASASLNPGGQSAPGPRGSPPCDGSLDAVRPYVAAGVRERTGTVVR